MAAADIRHELTCSICQEIYTDPVSLPCGHNFCQVCIERTWKRQESLKEDHSCPECTQSYRRKPELKRNGCLSNIAKQFFSTHPEQDGTGIFCNYCIHSPVPATKSCLLCEAFLCDAHVRVHSKSAEHVLTEPTASFSNRKCSVHNELLKGHRVELLNEASEKKKEKLRNVLVKLSPYREKTERGVQRLQERMREVAEKAAGETEKVTALFRDIKEQLEALEKRLLSDISRQKEELSLQLTNLIQELEIKKIKLSRKICQIEELCNMADPLTVLQEQESDGTAFCGAEETDDEDRERDDIKVPAVDVDLISEKLLTGLVGIVTDINGSISRHKDEILYSNDINTTTESNDSTYPISCNQVTELTPSILCRQEATVLALDINTAANNVSVSEDRKTAIYSLRDRCRPQTPERFKYYQALSLISSLKPYSNDINRTTEGKDSTYPISCNQVTEFMPSLLCWQEATDLVLDINTAANNVSVSEDGKTVSYSLTDQCRPPGPERFNYYQALSKESFHSRQYYWEVEGSKKGDWRVGVAYPSIERDGVTFHLGDNCKSWCLCKENNDYSMRHDRKVISLPHVPSCRRIRILLDNEAGRLSFYELSESIRHLHTFTGKFTEPLHAAFWVGRFGEPSVTIISSLFN
ncbi:hypothetical protein XELAEV_18046334mg [Xenopus laevis]|uniref:Uncharacterized protein n=1 Tax=Xenopus laevis TaxID=8355 RepID=A0A974H0H7_XENLA|nr:hypothetical protein XELAEV_18046334mg [Xenopus laevis]